MQKKSLLMTVQLILKSHQNQNPLQILNIIAVVGYDQQVTASVHTHGNRCCLLRTVLSLTVGVAADYGVERDP